jgi:hypothetical protein
MWYSGSTDTPDAIRGECGARRHLGYAYSENGIDWVRPNLGIISFNGSIENSLVQLNAQAPSVFLIGEGDAGEGNRFIMLTESGQHTNITRALYSRDGMSWRASKHRVDISEFIEWVIAWPFVNARASLR